MNELPKNAKQVFKGVIFDVWQWEQQVYDGSKKIFEALKRPDTAQVVAVVNKNIIILNQKQPHKKESFFSLPGGRCEEGEDPLSAAKRELLEETGFESSNWKLWKKQSPYGKIIWDVYTFIAKDCRKMQKPNPDSGEKIDLKFFTFEEFLDLGEDKEFRDNELQAFLIKAKYHKPSGKIFRKLLLNNK